MVETEFEIFHVILQDSNRNISFGKRQKSYTSM
jgi:hypothetical protein